MGTRHLICVYSGGKLKVAQYGQWDGYPSGEGLKLLGYMREIAKSGHVLTFKKQLRLVSFFRTRKQALAATGDGQPLPPHLSRDTSAGIIPIIAGLKGEKIKLVNDVSFGYNSLFCEWAYVVDLDENRFEVYRGHNNVSPPKKFERFYSDERDDDGYYPVRMIASYPLLALPDDDEFLELEKK